MKAPSIKSVAVGVLISFVAIYVYNKVPAIRSALGGG